MRFYCVTKPQQRSDEQWQFSVWNETGLYRNEQSPSTQQGIDLESKGAALQMLSLPDNWDYTLAGLSRINRESIDAIRTAVWELEKAGYITRRQGRDEKGKNGGNRVHHLRAAAVGKPDIGKSNNG